MSTADLPSWDGLSAGDKFGIGLAVLGDTDGDGYDDLIIGAPSATGGASWSGGEAFVLNGPIDESTSFALTTDMDARIKGREGGAYMGRNLGAVGDFNGDGLADALVGVLGFDRAVMFFGPIEAELEANDPDDVGVTFQGPSSTETGIDVSGAGDVDGDGLADVLIGAHYGGSAQHGKIFLVYGDEAPSSVITLNSDVDTVFTGAAPSDHAGERMSSGDVDGDGRSDLLIAAPAADGGSINAGVVYVVVDPEGTMDLGTDAWLTLRGARAYGAMGTSLAFISGSDGSDGSHIVAGAPASDSGDGASPGDVWIFEASSGGTLETSDAVGHLTGTEAYDQAGSAVASVGDMDGDGVPDLMVGQAAVDTTVANAGAVMLFSGGGL
jgi:hypothetical protein